MRADPCCPGGAKNQIMAFAGGGCGERPFSSQLCSSGHGAISDKGESRWRPGRKQKLRLGPRQISKSCKQKFNSCAPISASFSKPRETLLDMASATPERKRAVR